jgi:5-formyltetrahydrofolate cyclo-ligase
MRRRGSGVSDAEVDRRALRRRLRNERRALTGEPRHRAEYDLCRHLIRLGAFRRARTLGGVLAFDGEPELASVLELATRQRKRVFVPVVKHETMRFSHLPPAAPLTANLFGILEPMLEEPIDPRRLDLVLTPLVAFDDRGTRLGVGRGYYDRCFHFLRGRRHWHRPKLLGVGFSFQQVPRLERQAWDVPLWGVVTEKGARVFDGR